MFVFAAGCGTGATSGGGDASASPDAAIADASASPDAAMADAAPADDLAAGKPDLAGLSCTGSETFQQAQSAMLTSCGGFPQCHLRAPFAGDLDLTQANAYADLVNVAASIAPAKLRVKPFDPAGSFLVQKLTNDLSDSEGSPMPRGEGIIWMPPDPAKLKILECWIANGAKHD